MKFSEINLVNGKDNVKQEPNINTMKNFKTKGSLLLLQVEFISNKSLLLIPKYQILNIFTMKTLSISKTTSPQTR